MGALRASGGIGMIHFIAGVICTLLVEAAIVWWALREGIDSVFEE